MGHILYDEIMRYNPKNPYWFNRDRFVLSAGHGCMLQYALLHLAGYDSVQEDDLKNFRQWQSRTPGHPENFETPGVEVTTGPLGQGIANAVGMALAEKHLAARFNKPDNEIVDHYTYAILGDGCQMEGVANEACSLAGHWGLGKLIAFYDDNHISIDGDTEIAFTENVEERFKGLGWHVIWVKNGNTGYDEIRAAIKEAKAVKDKPTLIKVTTTIGYGSPNKANSYSVHGSALGAKEVDATRKNLVWPHEPFHVPEDVKGHWSRLVQQGAALEAEWNAKFAEYEKKYKDEAAELKLIITGELPAGWEKALPGVEKGGYIISDNSSGNNPDIILIGTGSELEIAAKAADELRKAGKAVRVVSLVSWELFDNQLDAYKESVLPSGVSARVSIEAGSTFGWEKIVGSKGKAIGIDRFGASAPAGRLYKEFGLTPEAVVAAAKELC
ncbi:hypothetical protein GOBAR_AA30424 [Gossypium barbadense]|uniref:transketolase n=1 Tax=Gossypium barbadense TaxID=3634 RepID=A0A2P5WGN3_GOSBA|nr:hypothetical protein GOBAR_AA30424 [Gossypium barbadense]